MDSSQESRVGKFTTVQVTESEASEIFAPKAASKEANGKPPSPADRLDRQSSADSLDDAFTLKTSQATRRRRAVTPKKPIVEAVAAAPANYSLWSQLIIGSANTVVVTWLGTECSMEKREADMLEPPIARILARLTPEQANQVSVFIDPMVMLIALGMWGNRIIRIQRAKKSVNGISQEELARASGMVEPPPQYQENLEPVDLPDRTKVQVNPNGVPVAITEQMGDF